MSFACALQTSKQYLVKLYVHNLFTMSWQHNKNVLLFFIWVLLKLKLDAHREPPTYSCALKRASSVFVEGNDKKNRTALRNLRRSCQESSPSVAINKRGGQVHMRTTRKSFSSVHPLSEKQSQ